MKNQLFVVPLLLLSPLAHAGFNFGDCSGSGTFEQQIIHYGGDYENTITVGEIPAGIQGLKVSLTSDKDVDIRLYGANKDKIVHWPYGILDKSIQETKPYRDVNVTYSGYNGVDGEKGHEFIEINATTPTIMTMKAFGYQSGYATVNYSWDGKEGCDIENNSTQGTGSFTQEILEQDTILVGTIPPHIENVEINLTSEKDLDIQLYGVDGTAIVSWKPKGLLSNAMQQSIEYHGMNITWSGYNGTNGQAGHEFIKISGLTSEMLVMKVFGYEAGEAAVSYSWGNSANQENDNAIILAYAEDSSNQVPTVQNYKNIGLSDKTVNTLTLEEVNTMIASSDVSNIDTFTELLHVLSQTSACLSREELDVMIDNDENLTQVNTECITDMSELFGIVSPYGEYNEHGMFNQNIGGWDVSNVTNMFYMFGNVHNFNQDISNWNVSKVTNMGGMFSFIYYYNQNIGGWDVSNVTNMSSMFHGANHFNQDIGEWNVSSVTDMSYMFASDGEGVTKFNQDIGEWNVSSVTDMSHMFIDAGNFNQNLNNWDVSNVTDMSKMFYLARKFNGNMSDWNVSSVTNMSGLFDSAWRFNQDISEWDVSIVTDMSRMFSSASFFNQDIGDWNVSKVTTMRAMFDTHGGIVGEHGFNQDIGDWNTSNVTDMSIMFYKSNTFNQNIGNWDVSKVKNMAYMFSDAKAFNQPIGDWDVSSVTDMSRMFADANAFNQPINNWDVSNVTNMSFMFSGAKAFNQNISEWNTNNVTHYSDFSSSSALTTQNSPTFD